MYNLDAMDRAECWRFWEIANTRKREFAEQAFPDKPRGYVRAFRDLGHYACNKAVAMDCRARGDIATAQTYETICDNIYRRLPAFARW